MTKPGRPIHGEAGSGGDGASISIGGGCAGWANGGAIQSIAGYTDRVAGVLAEEREGTEEVSDQQGAWVSRFRRYYTVAKGDRYAPDYADIRNPLCCQHRLPDMGDLVPRAASSVRTDPKLTGDPMHRREAPLRGTRAAGRLPRAASWLLVLALTWTAATVAATPLGTLQDSV